MYTPSNLTSLFGVRQEVQRLRHEGKEETSPGNTPMIVQIDNNIRLKTGDFKYLTSGLGVIESHTGINLYQKFLH